ncbi:hypothetical protein FKP32DRAFT_1592576 [Trametes sanguinea]|nr:hypothetical protein FKP32DRAFT_1592576 [Trametes sanguinea]
MATDNPVEVARVQMLAHLQGLSQALRQCSDCVEHFTHTLMGGQPQPFPPHLPLNGHFPIGMAPPFIPVAQEEGKKRKRGEDAEGKKRAKKPKDPNAPKRPASSYLLFQNDVRNELKAKHPDMRNNELLSTIAKLWAEMPQSQKDVCAFASAHLRDMR